MEDSTMLYGEQISHHPPVSAYHAIGPNNEYQYFSRINIKGFLNGMNSFKGIKESKHVFSFKDGGLVSVSDPSLIIDGLVIGTKVLNLGGTMTFADHINRLEIKLKFGPPKKTLASKLKFWQKNTTNYTKDYF